MAKEVHLLNYWMPLLRKIKEFKEIANTEEPELRYILAAIDRTKDNMFIETADEYAIKRFEDIAGLVPDEGDSLDIRRLRVLTKWNEHTPYTDAELFRRLASICGSADLFEIEEHYEDYWLKITTTLGVAGAFDLVADALKEMLPCNLELELANKVEEKKESALYVGGVCCTALAYCITHDITGTVSIDEQINSGTAIFNTNAHVLTHDVHLYDVSSLDVTAGVSTSIIQARVITQDIHAVAESREKPQVATSVNVATTITLK